MKKLPSKAPSAARKSSHGPVADKSQMSAIARLAGGPVDSQKKRTIAVKGR